MPKIGEMEFNGYQVLFWMDGDRFTVIHKGNRYHFEDEELEERFNPRSYTNDKCFDSGAIGMEPGKLVRIPKVVLQTRDLVRKQRLEDPARKLMKNIGETFTDSGCFEFFMFGDAFVLIFEKETKIIKDDDIQKTEHGFCMPAIKGIPESQILIPDDVLEKRDKIRAENERERHREPMGKKDGYEFFLNDDINLIVKLGEKEIIAAEIETIYGRPAVNIEAFGMDHPFLEIPAEVTEAFRKARGNKLPEGLKIVPAGKSLLDGAEYWKLNKQIQEEAFNKVQMYFDYFGEESGDFSGWLTKEPGRVADTLKIEAEF